MFDKGKVFSVIGLAVLFGIATQAGGDIIARSSAYVDVRIKVGSYSSLAGGAAYTESNIGGGGYMGQTDYQQDPNGSYPIDISSYVEQADVRNMAQGEAQVNQGYLYDSVVGRAESEAEISGEPPAFAWAAGLSDAMAGFTRTSHTSLLSVDVYYGYVVDLLNANPHIPDTPGDEIPEAMVVLRAAMLDGIGTNMLTPKDGWQQGQNCLEMVISSQSAGFYQADSDSSNWIVTVNPDVTYTAWAYVNVEAQSPAAIPEPVTMGLLAIGGLALLGKRK